MDDEFQSFVRMTFHTAASKNLIGREEVLTGIFLEQEFRAVMRREFGTDNVRELNNRQLGELGAMFLRQAEAVFKQGGDVVSMIEWRSRNQK